MGLALIGSTSSTGTLLFVVSYIAIKIYTTPPAPPPAAPVQPQPKAKEQSASEAVMAMSAPRDDLLPPKDDPFTQEQLKAYDGSNPDSPIYVAIKGTPLLPTSLLVRFDNLFLSFSQAQYSTSQTVKRYMAQEKGTISSRAKMEVEAWACPLSKQKMRSRIGVRCRKKKS